MKKTNVHIALLLALTGLAAIPLARAQSGDRPPQLDLSAGLHSFYIPGMGARWGASGASLFAGLSQPLNARQSLNLGLRLGYARGRYQGDVLQAQVLLSFTPLIARHIEPGIALGAGYLWSFYPSRPLRHDGDDWARGRPAKGLIQAPLQLSIGYRAIKSAHYEWRPYVAYQIQTLFGYSPDLSVLPLSHALLGVKISPRKEEAGG